MKPTDLFAVSLVLATCCSAQSSSGSAALENEILAYRAITKIATQVDSTIGSHGTGPVLLGNPANMSELGAFFTFKETADNLEQAYKRKEPAPREVEGEFHPNAVLGGALGGANLGATLEGLGAVANAIKASTSTTSSTFTPIDQAFIFDLEAGTTTRIVSMPLAPDLKTGGELIADELSRVYKARKEAADALIKANPSKPGKDSYDPSPALKDLDSQFSALQSSLASSSASPASPVLQGAGLLAAVGVIQPAVGETTPAYADTAQYRVLSFASDAAGGGTRTNQIFLISYFLPWPHPSYNGGAVISFKLTDQNGAFLAGGTLDYLFDYTRPTGQKVTKGKP